MSAYDKTKCLYLCLYAVDTVCINYPKFPVNSHIFPCKVSGNLSEMCPLQPYAAHLYKMCHCKQDQQCRNHFHLLRRCHVLLNIIVNKRQ